MEMSLFLTEYKCPLLMASRRCAQRVHGGIATTNRALSAEVLQPLCADREAEKNADLLRNTALHVATGSGAIPPDAAAIVIALL
jgi:hypothetical protein